jgi:hypothetical protein
MKETHHRDAGFTLLRPFSSRSGRVRDARHAGTRDGRLPGAKDYMIFAERHASPSTATTAAPAC